MNCLISFHICMYTFFFTIISSLPEFLFLPSPRAVYRIMYARRYEGDDSAC